MSDRTVAETLNAGTALPPRAAIEAAIQTLIDVLDALDGDPDLEDADPPEDADADSGADDHGEPDLGWHNPMGERPASYVDMDGTTAAGNRGEYDAPGIMAGGDDAVAGDAEA